MRQPLYVRQLQLGPMKNFVYLVGAMDSPEVAVVDPAWDVEAIARAVAEDGKANQAVIALLARTWHLPRSSLSLVQGASARNKRLHLAGNPAELQARITQWWQTHAGRQDD